MRGWGFEERSRIDPDQMPEFDREIIRAFSDGVNQALDRYPPVEYAILGIAPEPWTPSDCLMVALVQSWSITHNWEQEAVRLSLALQLGLEHADAIYPNDPIGGSPTIAATGEPEELPPAIAPEIVDLFPAGPDLERIARAQEQAGRIRPGLPGRAPSLRVQRLGGVGRAQPERHAHPLQRHAPFPHAAVAALPAAHQDAASGRGGRDHAGPALPGRRAQRKDRLGSDLGRGRRGRSAGGARRSQARWLRAERDPRMPPGGAPGRDPGAGRRRLRGAQLPAPAHLQRSAAQRHVPGIPSRRLASDIDQMGAAPGAAQHRQPVPGQPIGDAGRAAGQLDADPQPGPEHHGRRHGRPHRLLQHRIGTHPESPSRHLSRSGLAGEIRVGGLDRREGHAATRRPRERLHRQHQQQGGESVPPQAPLSRRQRTFLSVRPGGRENRGDPQARPGVDREHPARQQDPEGSARCFRTSSRIS